MSASAALPGAGLPSIDAFRRLLETAAQAPADSDSPVQITDRLVGAASGELLRRCAVPHAFDVRLLAFMGELSEEQAEEEYARFTELSLMQIGAHDLSLHERWRSRLWLWWLAPEQRPAFERLNERLVQWFTRPPDPSGEDPAARRRMFHLIGWRHDEGMAEFDRLFRAARHRRRFSECLLLLTLVREYGPRLSADERALLDYHEGKIASDLRQWERALPLLRSAASGSADERLRVNAEVRTAHALRELKRVGEAEALLRSALDRTESGSAAHGSRWRVLYELGEIERDRGNLERAEDALREAQATCAGDIEADPAGILNSLGTVQLKRRDADAAVKSLEASLAELQRAGDGLRPGTVLNNLALAQLERCDWPAAESALRRSLEIKRSIGDLAGQATTLLNLARAQAAQGRHDEAVRAAEEAQALFERAGDAPRAALARQTRERLAAHAGGTSTRAAGVEKGFPLWGWVLVVIGVLLVLLIAVSE